MTTGKKTKKLPDPNIVETYQLGNTTVHIADNAYHDKSPEAIKQVWKDFYAAGWVIWNQDETKQHENQREENSSDDE
ncbi:hypothetical protein [Paenibacillus sp. HB172176]|uniref:hypothetical protein n=1 Tax=Paenibacillus sp. HB172176 TaxID=2493690 RepID=UPI0014391E2D|nr:hypothetical protein [Paenibacillus sp. HB172176]